MLCVVLCGVSLWSWCVFGVYVCLCVFLCVLLHTEKNVKKNRVWIQRRLRVYIQNVPVYTGTTRTCARGAGTHGDVLNPHTVFFFTFGVITWPQRSTKETRGSFPFAV